MLIRPSVSSESAAVLRLPSISCPVELRRSSRAKRFSLKVSHTERAAILTVPNRGRVEDASAFLNRHEDWLKRQLEKLPEPVPFVNGAIIPLRGNFHTLQLDNPSSKLGVVWVKTAQEQSSSIPTNFNNPEAWLNISSMRSDITLPQLCVSGGLEHAPRRLSDWLRSEARKDLVACVAKHAETLGCAPKRISIRDQSTRWGSCSTTGTISFSWRLIFGPSFVLDYVAAHEVAHLREMNHGPRFWRLVREAFPGMQKARQWLKVHGADLHRFGSPDKLSD